MKPSRLLIPAIAFLAVFSTSAFAKKYTPATFRSDLALAMAHKQGPPAYNKASTFLQRALADRRNKKYARTFAQFTQNALRGSVVKIPLRGVAANTLVKGLIAGYFADARSISTTHPSTRRSESFSAHCRSRKKRSRSLSEFIIR